MEIFKILTNTHPEGGEGCEQKGFDTSTSKDNALERRPLARIVLCLTSLKLLLATFHALERPLVGCERGDRAKSDAANTVKTRD